MRPSAAQLGQQRDSDTRGDQADEHVVVVALEGDVGLEAGLGAGVGEQWRCKRRRRSRSTHGSSARSREADRLARRQADGPRARRRTSGRPAGARSRGRRAARWAGPCRVLEDDREVEVPALQARRRVVRLALGEGQLDLRVALPVERHRLGHERRAGARKARQAHAAALQAGDRGELALGVAEAGEDDLGVRRRARARRRSGARRRRRAAAGWCRSPARAPRSAARPRTG